MRFCKLQSRRSLRHLTLPLVLCRLRIEARMLLHCLLLRRLLREQRRVDHLRLATDLVAIRSRSVRGRTRRFTASDMAKSTRISQSMVSKYMTGAKRPSAESVEKLATYFGLHPDDIWFQVRIDRLLDDHINKYDLTVEQTRTDFLRALEVMPDRYDDFGGLPPEDAAKIRESLRQDGHPAYQGKTRGLTVQEPPVGPLAGAISMLQKDPRHSVDSVLDSRAAAALQARPSRLKFIIAYLLTGPALTEEDDDLLTHAIKAFGEALAARRTT